MGSSKQLSMLSDGRAGAEVDAATKAMRIVEMSPGYGYAVAATSGTISQSLGANSTLFALRLSALATRRWVLETLSLEVTTIGALVMNVSGGRRLAWHRASGVVTGGSAVTGMRKVSTHPSSQCDDIRMATTSGLLGMMTVEPPLAEMSLAHMGAAGSFREKTWHFGPDAAASVILEPGQSLILRNPQAMDATGTWQVAVNAHWYEV